LDACEIDVLVDVLRDLRARATRDAADTYATTSPGDTRPIDHRHDRLRGLEGLLMQLEEQPPDERPGAVLMGATPLLRDIAQEGAREALERLHDAHERYEDHVTSRPREALLGAARTAKAWITTLTAVENRSTWAGTNDASQPERPGARLRRGRSPTTRPQAAQPHRRARPVRP
jgi:hypothetical protein